MYNKYFFAIACVVLSWTVGAQEVDLPLAKIRLYDTRIITTKDFKEKLDILRLSVNSLNEEQKKQFLDELINNELLLSAAEKEGIDVTEEEFIQESKRSSGAQDLSDESFKANMLPQLSSQNITWEKFLEVGKISLTIREYVMKKSGPELQKKIKEVDPSDVKEYYEGNKSTFVNPDYVRFSMIKLDFTEANKSTVKDEMSNIYDKISSQDLTFEESVRLYSEDVATKERNGDFGFLPRGDKTPFVSYFGIEFINQLFTLKKGSLSSVLEGKDAFYIVKITEKIDQKFLSLDDMVSPGANRTVDSYINDVLGQQEQLKVFQSEVSDLAKQLRKDAEVQIYDKNFSQIIDD